MVIVDLDSFETLQPIPEELATKQASHQQKKQTLYEMDDASYPNTMESTARADDFILSRVDLDESVVGSTSSSEDADGEDLVQQRNTYPKAKLGSRKQRRQQEERLQYSHSKGLICIVAAIVLLGFAFAAFMKFGWKSSKQSNSTETQNASLCQLCPDGFGLSTPSNKFDLPTSASSVKGMTCAQVWKNAESGEYDNSLRCALVKSEASSVCECNEELKSIEIEHTSGPVSALPTASPTMAPLYVPPNPVPQNRAQSYFNYDLADNRFGPNSWPRIDMTGTYFREFGENGFGTWDGHLQFHVADSTLNRCGHEGKQSPVNLIRTTWGESKCTASHQIRTRVSV